MAKMPKHLPVKEQTRGALHGILEQRGIVRELQVLFVPPRGTGDSLDPAVVLGRQRRSVLYAMSGGLVTGEQMVTRP